MNAPVRPTWSALQRDRLAAMGLELYVRADPGADPRAVDAPSGTGSKADRRADDPSTDGAPGDDRLLRALLRAAGVREGGPAADAVRAALPPVDAIRGNPAAKRALWPRLRAMRRGRGG